MTDQEYTATKDRLDAALDGWKSLLGLSAWRLVIRYYRDSGEFATDTDSHGEGVMAVTRAQWEYMQASIKFNVSLCSESDDDELEDLVVHELMHVVLKETRYGTACDCAFNVLHEERVATQLARAFIATRGVPRK